MIPAVFVKQRIVLAAVCIGCFASILVVICFLQQGEAAAARCATALVMPIGLTWLVFGLMAVWNLLQQRRHVALVWAIIFTIWTLLFNGALASRAVSRIESPLTLTPHPAIELRELRHPLDLMVVLGGCTEEKLPGFVELTLDGERLVSAAQAYHAGTVRAIITTGSSTNGRANPSEVGLQILQSLNVDEARIFQIRGVNTIAEMRHLREFLDDPPESLRKLVDHKPINQWTVGLSTSAFHMPRAMRLAGSQGLKLIPLPCAFRASQSERPWIASDIIPNAEAAIKMQIALKESIAYLVGR